MTLDEFSPVSTTIELPFQLRRRGVEARIISGPLEPRPNPFLQRNLGLAHVRAKAIRKGQSIADLARIEGLSESHIRSRLALAFLSPTLQRAILTGNFPPQWTTDHLLNQTLSADWSAQECLLGL